MLLLLTTHS